VLPNGYRLDQECGVTDLTFGQVTEPGGEFGLSGIATVRTIFKRNMPNFGGDDISRLNRRTVHGNFLLDNSSLELKLTTSNV
jgi:hypothetical protein